MKTYPKMNAEIVGILRLRDSEPLQYAALRIEELEAERCAKHKTRDGVPITPGMTLWIHDKSDYWFEWTAFEFSQNQDGSLMVIFRNHEVTLGYPMDQCYAELPPKEKVEMEATRAEQ